MIVRRGRTSTSTASKSIILVFKKMYLILELVLSDKYLVFVLVLLDRYLVLGTYIQVMESSNCVNKAG